MWPTHQWSNASEQELKSRPCSASRAISCRACDADFLDVVLAMLLEVGVDRLNDLVGHVRGIALGEYSHEAGDGRSLGDGVVGERGRLARGGRGTAGLLCRGGIAGLWRGDCHGPSPWNGHALKETQISAQLLMRVVMRGSLITRRALSYR